MDCEGYDTQIAALKTLKSSLGSYSQAGNDVGTACAMLRAQMGWSFPEGDKEITAFTAFVGELQRMTDEKHNYVLDYFEGKLD